jgi:hypothetical protein
MDLSNRLSYAVYWKTQFSEKPGALCRNGVPDIHCTDGVSPIQGPFDKRTDADLSTPTRIDYIFLRGADTVYTSTVVFNPGNVATGPINPAEPAVSDHSGAFTQIRLSH